MSDSNQSRFIEGVTVKLRDGATATLYRAASGKWACPVCGSVELVCRPYFDDGSGSFDACSCGFEFGFDDDPGASSQADKSVSENWAKWRAAFLYKIKGHPRALAEVEQRLRAIGIVVAP